MLEFTLIIIGLANLVVLYVILVRVDQISMRPTAVTHSYRHDNDPHAAMANAEREHRGWFE